MIVLYLNSSREFQSVMNNATYKTQLAAKHVRQTGTSDDTATDLTSAVNSL